MHLAPTQITFGNFVFENGRALLLVVVLSVS